MSEEPGKKASVLIVDDQPANIHALAKLIRDDYHILAATSGAKALEITAGYTPPDLVLLDIMMPEMDGFAALEKIRQIEKSYNIPDSRKTKVVILTALRDPANVDRALKGGDADSYLIKPIQMESLRQVLIELGFVPEEQEI